MSEADRTRVGAYGLDADRRLLLCRFSDSTPESGRWTLPGGGIELGESPDAAVELAERGLDLASGPQG